MIDCSAVPGNSNGSRIFAFVADTEKWKISGVFVENLLRFKLPDVVFFEIALEDHSDFLKTLWRKFVDCVILSALDHEVGVVGGLSSGSGISGFTSLR